MHFTIHLHIIINNYHLLNHFHKNRENFSKSLTNHYYFRMGNCQSLSDTATGSASTRSDSIVNGADEAAMIYSDGMVMGNKVAVSDFYNSLHIAFFRMQKPSKDGFNEFERSFYSCLSKIWK